MRRALLVLIAVALVVGAAAVGTAVWVLYTPAGLAWALGRIDRASGGILSLEYETGTLGDGVVFNRIRYQLEPVNLNARHVFIRLSPLSLLHLAPHIAELRADEIRLAIESNDKPARPLSAPALPVPLRIDDARVAKLVIEQNGTTTEIEAVSFTFDTDALAHRVRNAHVILSGFSIAANATVATTAPFKVDADASIARESVQPRLSARVAASGSLQRLALNAAAESASARLNVESEIAPAAERPIERLNATLTGLDLHVLNETMPQTALSGEIKLTAEGAFFVGSVHFANALAGTYDAGRLPVAALRSAVRTDFDHADFADLFIDLGRGGQLSGSAQLQQQRLTLALATRNLDLRGVHGRLRSTQLAGRGDAALTPDTQSVVAEFKQGQMRLRFRAERAGDAIELREAVAQARGGEARAQGALALNGHKPFNARATFTGFDPAAWGDFPRGAINGRLAAQGTVEGPQARVTFAIDGSRLRDAPLAGAGRFSLAKQRVFDAELNVRLGPNRVRASGAFGARDDKLHLQVDAPRLATLDSRLAGGVNAEAQLSGTVNALLARFQASAEGLNVGDRVIMERVTANGIYSNDPSTPLRLSAEAMGVAAEGKRVNRLSIELDGTRSAHTAALRAFGPNLELVARARGGITPQRAWSGTLLEVTSHGEIALALESPVNLTVGARTADIDAFRAQIMGGRLEADRTRYSEGILATAGRFSGIPASAIALAAGAPTATVGTLRLSGSWSISARDTLTGSFTVNREAGDLALGRNGGTPLQLQKFAVEGRLDAERLDFRATLMAALASGDAEGSIATVPTDNGPRITAKSPLRITAKLAVAKLSAFAALADASVLVDGRINASLASRGTLGDPVVTGDIAADGLDVALPTQGIDLRDGVLRAALTDRSLRVDSFRMRGGQGTLQARGNLVFNGKNGTRLDWQADRLLLLGRPDRRLVVSGKGSAGLVDQKLSLAGELRADEGYFELGDEDLPKLGADVVVTGRKEPPKEVSRLANAALKLVLDFGSKLRIKGRGLDSELAGRIEVSSEPAGELRAKGAVQTVRGTYTAFGQKLEIERGQLLFTGPMDDPGLDIIAMRRKQAVEAGVAVTGTVRAPFARIVSEPPVPENEAIAWLVLGHGPSEASRGDLAMLPMAAGALFGMDGSGDSLAKPLGLDDIGMRGAGTEKQFVTVGKRISDRIYVGYEQGLGAALSILKLEFTLTKRWLLRAQSGETSALGLFFRYAFD